MALLSVLVPARNETYLGITVESLLTKAHGDTEVIVGLDGYWPSPALPAHPRLHILHSGKPLGLRGMVNALASVSRAHAVMKIDAHCLVSDGYDVEVTKGLDDETVVIPRRYGLDPGRLTPMTNGKYPIDRHYLSYPFIDEPGAGLHGTPWSERAKADASVVGEEMSSQGSCWVMRRRQWKRVGDLDATHYGSFIHEFQEVGLKTWLRGNGRCLVTRAAWYAHLHKGKDYRGTDGRTGRGYMLDKAEMSRGTQFATAFWMRNQWGKRTRELRWLIEHFWPVPTWPTTASGALDWDQVERDVARRVTA